MKLKVDLVPRGPYSGVVLLVDVLRATTTAPLLLSRGLETLYVTPSLGSARSFAAAGKHLLIGERDSLPPEGFNHSPSPATLAKLDFSGQSAVMTTQNGPRALPALQDAPFVLLASFFNARAATDTALEIAERQNLSEIAIVCAGQEGAESLDDALAAGFLVRRLERAFVAKHGEANLELRDAARLAIALLRAFPDPQESLVQAQAGRKLAKLGLHEDIAFASLISQTPVVPVLREVIAWEPQPVYRFEPFKEDMLGLGLEMQAVES